MDKEIDATQSELINQLNNPNLMPSELELIERKLQILKDVQA